MSWDEGLVTAMTSWEVLCQYMSLIVHLVIHGEDAEGMDLSGGEETYVLFARFEQTVDDGSARLTRRPDHNDYGHCFFTVVSWLMPF